MDWNRAVLLGAQAIVVIVLGVVVAMHESEIITDALLAVSASITGVGVFQTFKKTKQDPPA